MNEPITSTSESTLTYIEGQVSFFERNLNNKNRESMSTTTILGSVMLLLTKALIANAKELRRMNDREDRIK